MTVQKKTRKLTITKRTILNISAKTPPGYWIKTTGGPGCPATSGGPLCVNELN